ncbi:MAG: hypothetical protein JWP97_1101 [Labilithrix sp.]|nr:hypothetical protein [Labilithrix sp.]
MTALAAAPLVLAAALLAGACGSDDGTEAAAIDGGSRPRAPGSPDVPDAGSGSADATTTDGASPSDPCATKAPACPTTTTTAGSGVVALDRCAFPMKQDATWSTLPPLVDALAKIVPVTSLKDLFADLNRVGMPVAAGAVPGGPAGVSVAVRWNDEDDANETWTPQGLSGSADAAPSGLVEGRRILLSAWYYTPPAGSTYEKGVRVAVLDVTDPAAPRYRFALLVEPKGSVAAPTFAPVLVHAGGLVWIGDLLYVPVTATGFRVFDMKHILATTTDVDEIGCSAGVCRGGLYKYVIPQIGSYTDTSACAPIYSSVSLDRSTSPPTLLASEYCGGTACGGKPLAGRAYRWPLDPATGRLSSGIFWPSEAMLLGQQQVQGTASRAGVYYMSSSAPAASAGALYRVKGGKSATSTWLDFPEDLMVDAPNGLLWTQSEGVGTRVVAGMKLTSYPAP